MQEERLKASVVLKREKRVACPYMHLPLADIQIEPLQWRFLEIRESKETFMVVDHSFIQNLWEYCFSNLDTLYPQGFTPKK
ncbi:unnamed protein product [Sphenostylis stenocarpa]|uniref:Uncharacterized protein n=1 Tax=Sphenostylis stenocarpa TaxID=92480 RepID=A0AA87B9G0_9FABA|nr:unnamed protein product [Sphenostylis stenocarpa]